MQLHLKQSLLTFGNTFSILSDPDMGKLLNLPHGLDVYLVNVKCTNNEEDCTDFLGLEKSSTLSERSELELFNIITCLIFLSDIFLEVRAEILTKILLVFC